MASIVAKLPPPILFIGRKQISAFNFQRITLLAAADASRGYRKKKTTTATGKSSAESTASLSSVVESDQKFWNKLENLFAVLGLGLAAVFYLHATLGFIGVIDKLPLLPYVFQVIGLIYSCWFVWRYLLYRPGREELYDIVKTYGKDIL